MRRRLRRRPVLWKALTPKSTKRIAPGSDDSGALRLALFSALKAVIVLVPTGWGGWDAIPFLRSCRGHPPYPDAPLLLASRRRAPGAAP